jgi:hypothetical protein
MFGSGLLVLTPRKSPANAAVLPLFREATRFISKLTST